MAATHVGGELASRVALSPLSSEQGAVGVECRLPAQVCVQHGAVLADVALADEVDQPGHGLAFVHRVEDDALEAAGEPNGVQSGLYGDTVVVAGPAFEHGDLFVAQFPAESDELGGVAGDLRHLGPGLG